MDMHRMTWPEVICVAVSVLGVAMATAWLVAGNGTLAFLGVVVAGGAWAVYNMLADARESTHVRPVNVVDFRRASDLDTPDYEAHQILETRVLCAHAHCGQMGTLYEMGWDEVLGPVCKAHERSANPTEAA
jgi:hypothetical protein